MITIFHWDLPCWLQDLGGVTNPLFVEYFKEFSDVLFRHFGSKVVVESFTFVSKFQSFFQI